MMLGEYVLTIFLALYAFLIVNTLIGCCVLAWVDRNEELYRWLEHAPNWLVR